MCMMREIRVIRTNATQSESLAISDSIPTVTGMATCRVKVLVSVCTLGVKVSDQSIMFLADRHIQEVDLLVRNLEVNLMVLWKELMSQWLIKVWRLSSSRGQMQNTSSMKRHHINGRQGAASNIWCSSDFKSRHEKACKWRSHPSVHTSPRDL